MKSLTVLAFSTLVFTTSLASAQTRVTYGDGVHSGNIRSANQIDQLALLSAKKGDTLRLSFSSLLDHHMLTLKLGTKSLGRLLGRGVLTSALPADGTYWIEVQARNNRALGSYSLELDRLNDPVSSQRTSFAWNNSDSINSAADFVCYQIRANKGSKGMLSLSSLLGRHYAEVVDAKGKRLCVVQGQGNSLCSFPEDGRYVIFVAARNFSATGSFAVSVVCQSVPCDCTAYTGNYGRGWPGKLGVPTLTASAKPRIGTSFGIRIGSSRSTAAAAFVMLGVQPANVKPRKTGTLLVDPAGLLLIPSLSPKGLTLPMSIPNNSFFCGIGIALQSIVVDPAAKGGFAFSRGLHLSIGR